MTQNQSDNASSSFFPQINAIEDSTRFLENIRKLEENFKKSDVFIKKYKPLVQQHEVKRQEASKAIIFHFMRICGLKKIELPEDELDLIAGGAGQWQEE